MPEVAPVVRSHLSPLCRSISNIHVERRNVDGVAIGKGLRSTSRVIQHLFTDEINESNIDSISGVQYLNRVIGDADQTSNQTNRRRAGEIAPGDRRNRQHACTLCRCDAKARRFGLADAQPRRIILDVIQVGILVIGITELCHFPSPLLFQLL